MATIRFQGIIVAYGGSADFDGGLAVCCVSRIDTKEWRIISLEGKFADNTHNFAIEPGMLCSGKARLLKIWDGSILAEFLEDGFSILPADTITNFRGSFLEYVCKPRAERKIILACKEFYRFRLDETYYSRQISWKPGEWPFGRLPLNRLGRDRESMAVLEGYAMLFAKARLKYGKWSRKGGIFLLGGVTSQTHIPIFMLADADMGNPGKKEVFIILRNFQFYIIMTHYTRLQPGKRNRHYFVVKEDSHLSRIRRRRFLPLFIMRLET